MGGFLTVPAGGMVAFQPEVLYSQMGAKFTDDGEEFTAEVDEVQIPLLLRLGGGAATSGAYFLTGPSIGFITSAKFVGDGFEEDFKDDLKSTDFGFLVGGGVTISCFLLEARYTWGMTNLNDDDSGEENKSRLFSVLVGVGF